MEQTLGKRIVQHRKRLGMTQDALAEKLGVTAQAVSKWENDQSCPDITMLPKLAEIFGTTTDALLGIAEDIPALEATVIETDDTQKRSIPVDQSWEFNWNNSRKGSLMLAVTVLLIGGLYLIASLLRWNVGFWDIAWPSALLVFGLFGLYPQVSFFRLGIGLIGGYFLVNKLFDLSFGLDSATVWAVVLLLFGASLLVNALQKPKKPKVQFIYNGKNAGNQTKDFRVNGESFCFNGSFGDQYQVVEMSRLSRGEINASFGDYTVDLSGVAEITDGCEIDANLSFGELTVRIPSRYRVRCVTSTAFANVDTSGHHSDSATGTIQLNANASFGQINIEYI